MKKLILLLFLIPNLVVARVCVVSFTPTSEDWSVQVKECNFEKGDIMKITAVSSSISPIMNAELARDYFCDFSQTISVVEWDIPPTLNISCVYKKN